MNEDVNELLHDDAFLKSFYSVCTLLTLLNGKKLNLANIFLLLLQNKNIRSLYKHKVDIDNDMFALKIFLYIDPTLHKSKYIMKYVNSVGKKKLK